MKLGVRVACAVVAFALSACSGNFATGTSAPGGPGLPPFGQSPAPMPDANASFSPGPNAESVAANAGGDTANVSLTDATAGLQCPTVNGYSCLLRFNVPDATPSPSPSPSPKGKKSSRAHAKPVATPTPTPTPSPSPSPSPTPSASPPPAASPLAGHEPAGASSSPAPRSSPSGPTMRLKVVPQPTDAPALVHVPAGSLATVALMDVTLVPSTDFTIDGNVVAQFTIPAEQLAQRGFAVQLFGVQTHHKKAPSYRALYTFNKSSLQGNTLSFTFKPPKIKVVKGTTYLLVLYGDDHPAKPSTSPSPNASGLPSASPSPTPSPSPPVTLSLSKGRRTTSIVLA
ncbi:MAG TPA: hypothetical protein VIG51_10715 [Candidatus Baltobacteraceae bacterium]